MHYKKEIGPEDLDKEVPENNVGIWTPAIILNNKELTALEKLVLSHIDWLSKMGEKNKRYCWASNSYFANVHNSNPSVISLMVSKFIEKGWIEKVSYNGRTRVLRSNLTTTFKLKKTR